MKDFVVGLFRKIKRLLMTRLKAFSVRYRGWSRTERIFFLFVGFSLTFFAIFLIASVALAVRNYLLPVSELGTGRILWENYDNFLLRAVSRCLYDNSLFFQDRDDVFMDWFNINFMVYTNSPYVGGGDSSYPPLALAIAKIYTAMADYSLGAAIARNSARGILSICLFYLTALVPTFFLIRTACRRAGFGRGKTCLVYFAFILSTPFLFEYDRGNYVLLTLPLVLAFFLWYRSEKKWAREVSYLCLAAAVGIKIYPAAFALVLLREKRFSALVRTACYSVLALVLPFFCFDGGLDNVSAFLYWLGDFSSGTAGALPQAGKATYGISYSYSLYNLFAVICGLLGPGVIDLDVYANAHAVELVGKTFTVLAILCILFAGFTADRTWKIMLASALATLFVPSISFVYSGIMFVPAVLFFLFEREHTKNDYIYLGFFLAAFLPWMSPYVLPYDTLAFRWGMNLANLVQLLSYIGMLVLITVECVQGVVCRMRSKRAS